MKKFILPVCGALILGAVIFAVVFFGGSDVSKDIFAMDTYVNIRVKGRNAQKSADIIETLVNNLDKDILSRQSKDSYIYQLNSENGGKSAKNMSAYFGMLFEIAQKSNGKFDFTLGALSDLWGFGKNPAVPDKKEIETVLSKCGWEKVTIEHQQISFPEGLKLDLGAAGKGIALDEIKTYLESTKIREAVISLGGSILLYGKRDFTVGIANPENSSTNFAVLTLPASCVSTSGNYERFFEEDGKRYHHILDPETGYPVDNGIVSVTVVSQNGTFSDILSTACFAMGLEDGMALAKEYNCGIVVITEGKKVYVSDDLKDSIEIRDGSYTIVE